MKKLIMLASLGVLSAATIAVRAQDASKANSPYTPSKTGRSIVNGDALRGVADAAPAAGQPLRFTIGSMEAQQPFDLTPQHSELLLAQPEKPIVDGLAGEPVRFKLGIKNATGQDLHFSRLIHRSLFQGMRVNVSYLGRGEGGEETLRLVPVTEYGKKALARPVFTNGEVDEFLRPGEQVSDTIVLSRFFDMTLPGTYSVTMARFIGPAYIELPIKPGAHEGIYAVSQPVTVEIR